VLGIQDNTMMSLGNCHQYSFLSNGQRMKYNDLKYLTKEEIEKSKFELSENEAKLQKMLKLENNTIDILNENLKLKEMILFMKSNFAADMEEKEEVITKQEDKIKECEDKIKEQEEVKKVQEKEVGENVKALEKKQKDYDELYDMLAQREKEVGERNAYAESLLNEKKKLLSIIDGKDKEIEQLGKDLYHREKQFESLRDDLDRQILELQNEKKTITELSQHQSDQIQRLGEENAKLMNELAKIEMEVKANWDSNAKADLSTKIHELDLRDQEIHDLKDQLDDLLKRLDHSENEKEKIIGEFKEKANSAPKEDFENLLKLANKKNKDLQKDIDELNLKLNAKNSDIDRYEDQLSDLQEKLKRAVEENEEQDNFMKEHMEKLNLNENEKKKLQRLLDDEAGNFNNVQKELDLLQKEKEKKSQRIKEQEDELMNKNRLIGQKEEEIKNLNTEVDLIKDRIHDLEKENDLLKRENAKYGEHILDKIEDYKRQIAMKDDNLKNLQNNLKDITNDYNNLTNDFNKLNDKYTEDKKKIKELQDKEDLLTNDLNKNKALVQNLTKDLEQKLKELRDKAGEVEDLKKQLLNKADEEKARKKFEEQTREFYNSLRTLLVKIVATKQVSSQFYTLVTGEEGADFAADEASLKNSPDTELFNLGSKMLLEIDNLHKEMVDDIENMKATNKNLKNEKILLLEKTQDLEEKYSDLKTRHDNKTDMVGKLSVKTFVLMTEIEKLLKMQNAK
jgi:chromosome segregation ATPase